MNDKNLIWFNGSGDCLNFNYSDVNNRYEGDILFDINSNDTFKTYGLYMFEKVPSFEFELPGDLQLNKFQLFNEYGLDFYGAKYTTQSITSIEPVNNDPNFYSKWIYGSEFDVKFPIGTIVKFNSIFTEFINSKQTYTIVSTKKGAVMIIGSVDNSTFESTYYHIYTNPSSYINLTISGINAVGVYNYIDFNYNNNLSNWSEPNFYDNLFNYKKLNIVKSDSNDGTLTICDSDIADINHFEYYTNGISTNEDLIIELSTKTDLPKIYEGSINLTSNRLEFNNIPDILKPGIEFKIVGSTYNQNFLVISDIYTFTGNTQQTFYATQSQVMWNNRIYQCLQSYTQSYNGDTQYVNPNNTTYWTPNITYISVNQTLTSEYLTNYQLYLTTDKIYFSYGWTVSNSVTLASAAEKYKDDFKLFNIDLYYNDGKIKADLIYPSKYAEVDFYKINIGSTHSIGSISQVKERLIQVYDQLNSELNYNISSNFSLNIVFTDLDEYGFKIIINKQIYQEEINWIYSGSVIDMDRTIDRTLRSWLVRHYITLKSIGIIADLQYIGSYISPFYNSINLKTEYPNVPMNVDYILVGTTANYYIEHSRVLFMDNDYINGVSHLGSYLSIDINGDTYDQPTIMMSGTYSQYPNVSATIQEWVNNYSEYLNEFGILVSNINNLIVFNIKDVNMRLDYLVKVGKSTLPGINDFTITNKIKGNEGMLITSNEVTLPTSSTQSFESTGFSTGMVFSINNTFYPYNNQEYNIQYLNPEVLNLSYQGPFWATENGICNSSAFITLAFNIGYGSTACEPIIGPTESGDEFGPFKDIQFSSAFALSYNPNTYTTNIYNLSAYIGTTGLVDISYIQLSNSIYSFGDNLVVMDSYLATYLTTILLPGNTQSIKMCFNPINNYLYCLSKNIVWVIDPLLNSIITSIPLVYNASDIKMNNTNGDIYISYGNTYSVSVYNYNNTQVSTILSTFNSKMVFNDFEGDMYITGSDSVLRIDGPTRTIQTTYVVIGATNSIFYEPVNESVYVYGLNSLWKIDNGITQSISIVTTSTFNEIIFNNLTNQMNISETSGSFKALDLNTNIITSNSSIGNYGYMALSQFDGDVYLSSLSLNSIVVINPVNATVVHTEPMTYQTTKIIYNPQRKSIWTIQPYTNSIVEVETIINSSINIISPTYSSSGDDLYGTLNANYNPHPDIWLKTKDYVRKPRENYFNLGDDHVNYYWNWYSDNTPQFFMYDFTGNQLPTSGSYSYTGPKPLTNISLNKNPNVDIFKINMDVYQQTIFDKIEFTLSYIDDVNDISIETEPLELFLGFRSDDEGSLRSVLQLWKKENINIEYESTSINDTILSFITLKDVIDGIIVATYGQISINMNSSENFLNKGLKEGQHISIYVKDMTNIKKQYISNNNGTIVKIRNIYFKTLIVDFFDINDILYEEETIINDYPKKQVVTYLKTTLNVIDKEIGRFLTYAQTEIEDVRFKVELGNVGKLISTDQTFIFKEYDILEGGVDWTYLNKKRKEMMMTKHLIYPYIGAYKSIINAINFFGYNDLKLNEYYRNINPKSEKFYKLFKLEISDIFNNNVNAWTDDEYIKSLFPSEDYEETNMLNLTYFITDFDGNITLNYTIDEVIIKLQGLKYWLDKNVIPLTHNILDITGRSYFGHKNEITHTSYDVQIMNIKENMTPISFKLNEAYLMPINNGSTVYNCVLDFYTILDGVKLSNIKPYNGVSIVTPDYFSIYIRTYKTYKEWDPFYTYNIGDKIAYYGILYESDINNNRVKNPRKYESVTEWSINSSYNENTIVKYNEDFFISKTMSYSSITPIINADWLKITEWKIIDLEPVQTIKEFRNINVDILPFNFTIDSNIDPLISIEIKSDNGYGLTYTDKKNYEIRGTKDLTEPTIYLDPIGPFEPIQVI